MRAIMADNDIKGHMEVLILMVQRANWPEAYSLSQL